MSVYNSVLELDLRKNLLSEVSDALCISFPCLTVLKLNQNRIKTVSPKIKDLKFLKELHLNSNLIEALPSEFGELQALKKL